MLRDRVTDYKFPPIILIGLMLLVLSNVLAQRPIFKSIEIEIATENIRVHAVAQDHNNYLYFGTNKGLVKYNGIEALPIHGVDSVVAISISALCMASDGILWIGGSKGELNFLRKNRIEEFTDSAFDPTSKITDIYEDGKGTIWIATYGDGLYYIKNEKVYNITTENGLSDNYTYTIYEGIDHQIWIGTDAGITLYNPDGKDKDHSFSYLSTKDGLPDNIVRIILGANQGKDLWIAMQDSGICKFSTETQRFDRIFAEDIHWKYGAIGSMIIDMNSDIWIGTLRNGVIKVTTACLPDRQAENDAQIRSGKKFDLRVFSESNGLSSNEILSLFEDNEKNIWIGTRDGSSQYTRSPFEYLTEEDGLTSSSVYALLVDAQDNIWICTEREVIKYSYLPLGDISVKTYLASKGKLNQQVVSIFEDSDNNIWMGTYGNGVYVLNSETDEIKLYSESDGLTNNNIMSITQDKDGNIWLATLGGVSKVILTGNNQSSLEITNYTQAEGLGSNYVYDVYYDGKNYVWFATDGGGISKHNGKDFVPVLFPDELKSKTNYSVTTDRQGALWFSNAGGGIYKYERGKFVNYNIDRGLRDNSPGILTTGINDEIIVAHSKGIDVLARGQKDFEVYNIDWDQFDFDPNLNAFYNDSEGNIWIGTSSGIVKFRYVDDLDIKEEPVIILNNIRVKDKNIKISDLEEFEYDQNQFSFEFLGVWLKSPETVIYRYKLEGYEERWSRVTKERFVSYANLPAGEYVFMVKSRAAGGSWNEVPATFSFVINPPFWQTWWFYSICIIGLWSLSYLAYIQRMKYLQASNIILRRRVKEAKEELDQLKGELEDANETYV